MVQRQLWGS